MEESHEHAWRVSAIFRRDILNADGFVVDFLAVRDALANITNPLEGEDLNQALNCEDEGLSAERVAEYVAGELARLLGGAPYCVRVTEAPECSAAFYP